MLDANIQSFLRSSRDAASKEAALRSADAYADLGAQSLQYGLNISEDTWRATFRTRNAQVLVRQMMRQGMVEAMELTPPPQMDHLLWSKVEALNLEPVTMQLVNFCGWSEPRARAAERRYRRFYFLKALFPGKSASPSDEIDQYWHQHIINTAKYAIDCMNVAGVFLHHDFLSPDDPVDAKTLEKLRLETWIAYELLFDEPYEETLGEAFLQRWPNA